MNWLPIVLSLVIVLILGAIEECHGTRNYEWQEWKRPEPQAVKPPKQRFWMGW